MHWYKTKNDIPIVQKINTIGKEYSKYSIDEVELCYSEPIGKPSIVQVGVPHNITNPIEERLCICLVITKNRTRVTMQDALDIFKSEIES